MTYEVQQTRWDRLIRRVSGSIGPGSRVSETISELFPVLEVENTTPELLALADWRLAWQSNERPALVGNTANSQIFNPVGSGVIVAVTQVTVRLNAGPNFVQAIIVDATLSGAAVRGSFRDSRFGLPRTTVAEVRTEDGAVTGGGLRYAVSTFPETTWRDDNGLVVLIPGTGFQIGTTGSNLQMTVNYWWRERPAEEAELQF